MPPAAPRERVFLASTPRGAARWGYFFALTGIPLGLAGFAAWQTLTFYTRYGPVAAMYRPRVWWALSLLSGMLAMALCLRARWRRQSHVVVSPHGVEIHLAPHPPRELRWEDIHSVTTTGRTLTLHLSGGQHVRIGQRFDLPALAHAIQRERYAHLLPGYRRQWQAGEPLDFGALQISREGLHYRDHLHPWRHVQRVYVHGRRLVIELTHLPAIRIPLHRLHDHEALLWWLYEEARR